MDTPSWDDTQPADAGNAPKWQDTAPSISNPIDAFRAHLANHPARPNPVSGFDQDINQAPNATDPAGQQILEKLGTVAGGYGLGNLAVNAGMWGAGKAGSLLDLLKSAKGAESMAPASLLEEGLAAKDALSSESSAAKSVSNKLYDAIPKDIKLAVPQATSTADSIINEMKDLPASFQSKKILSLTGDIQNIDKASIPAIQAMRSTLSDIAVNGEGVEKMYAARLSKALASDVEAFGKTSALGGASEPASLEAQDLRKLWADHMVNNKQVGLEDIVNKGNFINPGAVQSARQAVTNEDIPANLNKANAFYKDLMDLKNHPVSQALSTARPEEMANMVFRRGNVDDVRVAQSVLGDTGFGAVQRQFYQGLMNKKDIGAAMSKYTPDFLQEALTPEMQHALKAIDTIKRAAKLGVKVAGGTALAGGAAEAYNLLRH